MNLKNRSRGGPDKRLSPVSSVHSSPDFPLRVTLVIFGLSLAVGFALRVLDLKADPPPNLSWSSAVYSDEAHNAYSARNWALYGHWQVDDYTPYVVYPWLNLFTGIVFRIAGIGFVQLKIVSLLSGLLLIIAMYYVGRSVSRRAGVIAAAVAAFSFLLVMYSRFGLAEMTQVLLVAATVAFLARTNTRRVAAALSGGCAAFAVLFVKVSALFLLVAALLVLVYEMALARRSPGRRIELIDQALFWLLGAAVPLVVWLVVIFVPHRQTYLSYVALHSLGAEAGHPHSIGAYLINAFSVGLFSRLYDRAPVVAALGFVVLPAFAGRAGRTAVFSALILVCGVAMLGYGYYHPPRYELFSLIPLIAGFAFAVDRLLVRETRIGHPWPHVGGALLYGLWLWPLAAQVAFRFAPRRAGTSVALIIALVAAQAVSFGLWRLHRATSGGIRLRGRLLRTALAAVFLLLAIGLDIKHYVGWYGSRTHLMYDCSRDLDKALPDNSVTGGFWAPAMLSTSHKRALFISNQWGANMTDPIARFGLTHLVITGAEEYNELDSITGGRVSQANVLRAYRINDRVLVGVVELRPAGTAPRDSSTRDTSSAATRDSSTSRRPQN